MLHKTIKRRGAIADRDADQDGVHGELESLGSRIEAELTRRELTEQEPAEGRRQVVEEKRVSAGTLRSEMVKCGKDRCKKCREGPAHGPYWYLYFRRNGKLTSRYIGKMIPEGLEVPG